MNWQEVLGPEESFVRAQQIDPDLYYAEDYKPKLLEEMQKHHSAYRIR